MILSEVKVFRHDDDVYVIQISNSKKKNSLSIRMLDLMLEGIDFSISQGCKSIVIWGGGECFSAGADFSSLSGRDSDIDYDNKMRRITETIENSSLIFVAAIEGYCIGAALDLALACDFRVATKTAKFSIPAVKVGILYNPERLSKISCVLGHLKNRMLLLGDFVTSEEARSTAIITHIEESNSSSFEMAIEVAKKSSKVPSRVQEITKKFINFSSEFSLDYWQQLRIELLNSEDRMNLINFKKGSLNVDPK